MLEPFFKIYFKSFKLVFSPVKMSLVFNILLISQLIKSSILCPERKTKNNKRKHLGRTQEN